MGSISKVKRLVSEESEVELCKQVLQVHRLVQKLPLEGSDHHHLLCRTASYGLREGSLFFLSLVPPHLH